MRRVRERRVKPVRTMLLDTHALVWWLAGDQRFRTALRRRIANMEQPVCVSAATGWELATKVRLGKFPAAAGLVPRLGELMAEQGFEELPISLEDGTLAGSLPSVHRDPFDRILAAQAMLRDLELVSADPAFELLGVETTW